MQQRKIKESTLLKNYLVSARVFTDMGEFQDIKGQISIEECKKYAKKNHRVCHGRGILNFDDGKVFYDKDGNRYVTAEWIRSCDCVNRKLEKNHYLIGKS